LSHGDNVLNAEKSFLYFVLVICIFPSSENITPCLPNLVASTQSNISNHCSIAYIISSGVPIPIKYLGLSFGNLGQVKEITSCIFSLLSPTLTHPTAIQSVANGVSAWIDFSLKSKYDPH